MQLKFKKWNIENKTNLDIKKDNKVLQIIKKTSKFNRRIVNHKEIQ